MWDFDLRFSLGSGVKTVNLFRAAWVLLLSQRNTLEPYCGGRHLRGAVIPRTDGLQRHNYGLTHGGGHVLPCVRAIEVQHMLFGSRRRSGAMSVGIYPQQSWDEQQGCQSRVLHT